VTPCPPGWREARSGGQHDGVSGPPPLSATWQRADELRARGEFAAARDLLEPAADVAAIRLGPDDRGVLETQRRLATVHRELGELASARRVLEEALDGGLLGLGDADPLILGISAELGAIADELGNKHEARRNLARVARYGPEVLGADHPYVRTAQRYLGVEAPLPAPPVPPWEPVEPGVFRAAPAPEPPPAAPFPPPAPEPPAPPAPPAEPALPVPAPRATPATWTGPGTVWDGPQPSRRAAEPAARSRRGLWITLGAGLAVLLVAGAAVLAVALRGGPPRAGTGADASPSPTVPAAPRDVRLRDNGASVTVTWTDPTSGSVPFLIAEGRAGEQLRALQPLPAGQTAYTLNGLNPTLDYCFAVVATYSTNLVATSDPVCTDRRHESAPPSPSPGRSR
jgi:hypothetical protein